MKLLYVPPTMSSLPRKGRDAGEGVDEVASPTPQHIPTIKCWHCSSFRYPFSELLALGHDPARAWCRGGFKIPWRLIPQTACLHFQPGSGKFGFTDQRRARRLFNYRKAISFRCSLNPLVAAG